MPEFRGFRAYGLHLVPGQAGIYKLFWCLGVYINMNTHIHIYIYTYVQIYTCTYIYMCVYVLSPRNRIDPQGLLSGLEDLLLLQKHVKRRTSYDRKF